MGQGETGVLNQENRQRGRSLDAETLTLIFNVESPCSATIQVSASALHSEREDRKGPAHGAMYRGKMPPVFRTFNCVFRVRT